MTSSGVYNVQPIPDPVRGQLITEVNPLRSPIRENVQDKSSLLKEYIEKYVRGEITKEQLDTIKKTLE